MERVCFLLKVKPDRLGEYKQRHKAVWPDMLKALRETGWRNYSLFVRDNGLQTLCARMFDGPVRIMAVKP
jgi:L-rhamnose mutarotase